MQGERENNTLGLFDAHLSEIATFLDQRQRDGKVSTFYHREKISWPEARNRNLVLGQDTAVELGNPQDESTSFLLWGDPGNVKNGRITIVGPDLSEVENGRISFGKIVIVGGQGFTPENSYQRYRQLDQVRYDIHLQGYMMRGVSQYGREWSRVSREARDNGFSLKILGGTLVDRFLTLDFVQAVEVIFVTAGKEDVLAMKVISEKAARIIAAMNKMAEELSFDCDTCEYSDVCSEVAELRSMRRNQGKQRTDHA